MIYVSDHKTHDLIFHDGIIYGRVTVSSPWKDSHSRPYQSTQITLWQWLNAAGSTTLSSIHGHLARQQYSEGLNDTSPALPLLWTDLRWISPSWANKDSEWKPNECPSTFGAIEHPVSEPPRQALCISPSKRFGETSWLTRISRLILDVLYVRG